jgi:hypothetical protein
MPLSLTTNDKNPQPPAFFKFRPATARPVSYRLPAISFRYPVNDHTVPADSFWRVNYVVAVIVDDARQTPTTKKQPPAFFKFRTATARPVSYRLSAISLSRKRPHGRV